MESTNIQKPTEKPNFSKQNLLFASIPIVTLISTTLIRPIPA